MRRSRLTHLVRSITLIASVAAPSLALAADLLPPLPPEPLPPPIEVGGGWYLRGDVGASAVELQSIHTTPVAKLPPGYQVEQRSVSGSYFAGAGVGYQFNAFLRGEITGEYRGGSRVKFVDTFPNGPGTKYANFYDANLSSVVVMANAAIDLGTWYGVTPFVTGGVGSAFHYASGFTDNGLLGNGIARDKNSTSLAWSAGAGLAYAVTPNVQLEIGYRYLNLGHANLGAINCFNNGCEQPYSYKAKDLTAHDVRIGMRWMLGGFAGYQPVPEPVPLIRKY